MERSSPSITYSHDEAPHPADLEDDEPSDAPITETAINQLPADAEGIAAYMGADQVNGGGYQCKCPSCDDITLITDLEDGTVTVICRNCAEIEIIEAFKKSGFNHVKWKYPESESEPNNGPKATPMVAAEELYKKNGPPAVNTPVGNENRDKTILNIYEGVSAQVAKDKAEIETSGNNRRRSSPSLPIGDKKNTTPKAKQDDTCNELTAYSLNGGIQKLKQELRTAVYLIDELAVVGELTIFGAPPNGGKTLLTIAGIIESVNAGRVDGSKIFYINCDDNQRGAISKTEILEPLGIEMVVPVLADREKTGGVRFDLGVILQSKITNDKIDGEVIILDTYKKFMSVMNKDDQREFNIILRDFVTCGGTVIVLAHTNKNKNSDGHYVLGGTSDLKDDADCCWIIDPVDTEGGRLYTFQFQKGRGVKGEDKCFFVPQIEEEDYTERYRMMLSSVEERDAGDRKDDRKRELSRAYHPAISLVREELAGGAMSRNELTAAYTDSDIRYEVPRRKFQDILMAFAGDLWDVKKVGRRKMFSLMQAGENLHT
jgi:hypothetical protein